MSEERWTICVCSACGRRADDSLSGDYPCQSCKGTLELVEVVSAARLDAARAYAHALLNLAVESEEKLARAGVTASPDAKAECPQCHGEGGHKKQWCPKCGGYGVIEADNAEGLSL